MTRTGATRRARIAASGFPGAQVEHGRFRSRSPTSNVVRGAARKGVDRGERACYEEAAPTCFRRGAKGWLIRRTIRFDDCPESLRVQFRPTELSVPRGGRGRRDAPTSCPRVHEGLCLLLRASGRRPRNCADEPLFQARNRGIDALGMAREIATAKTSRPAARHGNPIPRCPRDKRAASGVHGAMLSDPRTSVVTKTEARDDDRPGGRPRPR